MPTEPEDHTLTLVPRTPTPPAPTSPIRPVTDLPVDDPERYELVAEHARGGLGRVVRAVDRRLGRTVAVKELLRDEDWHEARFVREALITARLEHPGIVPVHEAGRWPNGAPYYAMKLVEGRTLKERLAETHALPQRLALLPHVIAIADAVGYAHSQGVIHRDLKPSNVIVGSFGETVVIDWGLARDRTHDLPDAPLDDLLAKSSRASTISGKVIGTPGYMAPEQARGEDVDERADVYAIGAVLYELLAGAAPHADGKHDGDTTPHAVLERVIAGPPRALHRAAPGAPAELVDIVAKAMAREPANRYANASELADDLRRFQTGKLVSAHPYTTWQLVKKKLAQHRGVVAMALASTVALVAIGVESFRSVVAQRDIAEREKARAEDREQRLVLVQAETSLRTDPTAALAWLKQYAIGERDVDEVVDTVDEALALGVARHVLRPGDWVHDAAFTPDGKTVVVAVRDGSLRAYDVATGHARELGHADGPLGALAIARDGSFVVTGGALGEVIAWPLAGAKAKKVLVEHGAPVWGLHVDATGTHVLVERDQAPPEIVALAGGVERVAAPGAMLAAVAVDDWSQRVALVAPNVVAAIGGGAESEPRVVARTPRAIEFVALSPCGEQVVIHDGEAVWMVPRAGNKLTKLLDYRGKIGVLAWSPDRGRFAIVGHRPEIEIVDVATGKVRELRGHSDALYSVEFARDGRALLSASDDGTARWWNLDDGSSTVLRGHVDDVVRARLAPDDTLAVSASMDGSVRVWPLPRAHGGVLVEGAPIDDLIVDGDRVQVTTATAVARWDLATGTRRELFAWAGDPRGLGSGFPSPDGERLLVPVEGFALELRRADAPPLVLRGHTGTITHVAWARDGRAVYTSSVDGSLRRWDAATGAATTIVAGDAPVRGFVLGADGRVAAQVGDTAVLVSKSGDVSSLGAGRAWCAMMAHFYGGSSDALIVQSCDRGLLLVDGSRVLELATAGYSASRVAVSPDGRRIAGAMGDRTVRVWDARTGKLEQVLSGHADLVMDVAFSADGARLASASYDHTVRVWQLATGRHRVLRGHDGPVRRVAWHGGDELVTASEDGAIRRWRVPSLDVPSAQEIAARLEQATTARIDVSNRATTR
jgi:WD40 repeat protein/tRNA A-37 threonylcarbamoyl transferase component Bud32